MNKMRHIAVIDIGKTNAKLALVDLQSLSEVDVVTRPNHVLPGPPWPHFDTEGHWEFLLSSLRDFHERYGVDGISITTHGACAALLARDGTLATPILDYEHDGPDALNDSYNALRPPFSQTGSPKLPCGLNIGAQLHWQFNLDPSLRDRVDRIVTYPQYWAYKLTGIAAIDVTSIGCHTDLWNPIDHKPSSLVDTLGIRSKLAPIKPSTEVLGSILPSIAAKTGLSPDTPVVCGIHDSNASLYPNILSQSHPFSVVSTGTWVIVMSINGTSPTLDPARDSLMNVNALGEPVPSARFMGGREFEMVQQGAPLIATAADVDEVLTDKLMLLPSVVDISGPFPGQTKQWLPVEPEIGTGPREVALSFYLALITAECLGITGAQGSIIVEGPFAKNQLYKDMLQAVTGQNVIASDSATGTSIGAALLFGSDNIPKFETAKTELSTEYVSALTTYSTAWRNALEKRNMV